jgi:hypothetical protein
MAYTTIDFPAEYFNTKLYTGTGSTQSITGVGFQPDLVWIKDRSDAYDHRLTDSVRGATKLLYSSLTNAEATEATSLTSFNSDGFSLGSANGVNSNTDNHVAWNWKANGAGVSNTSGSISSTVSANTTSGFSIVSYTGNATSGATVGHGLGVAPKIIIIKNRSSAEHWRFHTTAIDGSYDLLYLNLTNAKSDSSITAPTSSVFSLDAFTEDNGSGNSIIAYCFAEVKGYSKFGKYTGNGSADGTFVYTGMRPAFVLIKGTHADCSWCIVDNKRSTENVVNERLFADSAGAENTGDNTCDFLSNGFKLKSTDSGQNGSGNTYIYMCFSEFPFVTSKGIPTCAR